MANKCITRCSISYAIREMQIKTKIRYYYGTYLAQKVKEYACNVGDLNSIHGLGRSPGKENGYPLQYSCLENSMNRTDCWATVHGVTKSWTQLSDEHTHIHKSFRMAQVWNAANTKCWQGFGARGCSLVVYGNAKWYSYFGR